ncbi:M6 family metalloprotease domain-containing protein [Clostridium bornimense]|uniref:M6 family metalloprotease domain-containing protein n=1 Tax=Clostridium bornimense TaxID=1216932 RepID=W6RUF5_9CLOT|nr:M6 family metalloprotease domain-containing protein [Clostridium bornimense]CDM67269.1 M6 family metalloprotease domain-containing protein [Clostridium bornimense]
MKKLKGSLLSIVITATLCLGISGTADAAAYKNKEFILKQPDNTEVKVKITGDEYYQHIESIDGYTLCRNEDGWICYAKVSDDNSEYIATDKVYTGKKYEAPSVIKRILSSAEKLSKHEKIDKEYMDEQREEVKEELNAEAIEEVAEEVMSTSAKAKSNYTETETINGLTLLIEFPDEKSSVSKSEINNFFNQTGYTGYSNNGSVKDYFYDVSGGKVTYENTITEFYTAKNPKSYYDNVNESDYSKALELVNEALTWLKSTGFDFSKLTTDSNGMVKGVNILYAGNADAGWSKGLWPHQGYIPNAFTADGAKIQLYQMSNIGSELALDTVCHENGHLLFGYPDLYDYTGKTGGCGIYSLMSFISDAKNPAPPDPYCRNVISGWNSVIDLNSYSDGYKVTANSSTDGTQPVYKWSGENSNEYYLIENIKKSGRYKSMPDEGLMIWHVDENGSNSNQETSKAKHYELSVVQADNKMELENKVNYGADGDLFHSGYNDTFNDTSSPNSKWWDKTSSGLDISNISAIGETMTFVKSGNSTSSGTDNDNNTTENDTTNDSGNNDTAVTDDGNIAAKATVTTSYCSSWETINALNDGFVPVSSNDRNHDVYGNWPETDTQWVQYKFDKKYKISKCDLYWFKDNLGIDVPSSYKIKYMDNGNWKYVSNAKGLGVDINKFNTTTFDTITTDTIAVEMNSNNGSSTGIVEWKVYGEVANGTSKDTTTSDDSKDTTTTDDSKDTTTTDDTKDTTTSDDSKDTTTTDDTKDTVTSDDSKDKNGKHFSIKKLLERIFKFLKL